MLSLFKRKPKRPVEVEPLALIECPIPAPEPGLEAEPMLRRKQQNIKVTDDVGVAFDAIARALGISKAALFEDMVAERLEALQSRGVTIETSRS
jgi:biotin operon repressor